MKNKTYLIIRMGKNEVISGDMKAISEIQPDLKAMGMSLGDTGVLSIVYTELSKQEIIDVYLDAANQLGDILPVVVFECDQAHLNEFKSILTIPGVKQLIKEYESIFNRSVLTGSDSPSNRPQCELTLDQLLDKITRVGLDQLSQPELARLKSLS